MLKLAMLATCAGFSAFNALEGHFLWVVDSDKPSYLYGTIHSSDPTVRDLPAEVLEALATSGSFHPELELSPENLGRMTAAIFAPGGGDLAEELPRDLWLRLATNARRAGLPLPLLRRVPVQLTPLLFASPPGADFNAIIDIQVYELARQHQLEIDALETVDEQIQVFRQLPRDQAILLLDEALTEFENGFPTQNEMIRLYAAGDLEQLTEVVTEELSRLDLPALAEALLNHRNRAMAERLAPHLEKGGAFVAIGVGHMPGQEGVVALLEERGFRVTRVPIASAEPAAR